jgi:tetratricopeptide (TPR) repeat protein
VYTEDFILRMINQAVSVLLQIAGFRQAKQYQQAQQAIDQSLEQLLGLRVDLLKQLDDEVIFRMLTLQDRLDIERILVIAELFKAEGDILADQNHMDESHQSYLRALNFYLEARLSDQNISPPSKLAEQVDWLVSKADIMPLPDDIQWSLFNYYERSANYAKAEVALTDLTSRPGFSTDLQPEMILFYQRLLSLPPADLAYAQIEREQVQQKLDKLMPQGKVD